MVIITSIRRGAIIVPFGYAITPLHGAVRVTAGSGCALRAI